MEQAVRNAAAARTGQQVMAPAQLAVANQPSKEVVSDSIKEIEMIARPVKRLPAHRHMRRPGFWGRLKNLLLGS